MIDVVLKDLMFDCCDSLVFLMIFVFDDGLIFGLVSKIFVLVQVYSHVWFGHNIINFMLWLLLCSFAVFLKLD
jgi:hypothetical protein